METRSRTRAAGTTESGDSINAANTTSLRPKTGALPIEQAPTVTATSHPDSPDEPPHFTIDLSLPPEQRYLEVCAAFKSEMLDLTSLFDEVVGGMVNFISLKWLRFLCRTFLRGIYNKEENAELRGISKASGVDMYLLVCFNVLLDLFMGCSSGGAVVRAGDEIETSKMVHFRTLDWDMPALRRVIVHLDFIREKDGPVIASSITYAGFVGVLTGVRKDLSMSLNFRPNRIDNGKFWADVKYIWHLLMVLLGYRPSIASTLRGFLLPRGERRTWWSSLPLSKAASRQSIMLSYATIVDKLSGEMPLPTTACYLCFSNGAETTTIEKDRVSAVLQSSDEFIIVTNTDAEPTTIDTATSARNDVVETIISEAKDRQQCALHNWTNLRARKSKSLGSHGLSKKDFRTLIEVEEVVELVQKYPTTNEMTHFACVMDPSEGKIVWCRRWNKPVGAKWIRAHMSETW